MKVLLRKRVKNVPNWLCIDLQMADTAAFKGDNRFDLRAVTLSIDLSICHTQLTFPTINSLPFLVARWF